MRITNQNNIFGRNAIFGPRQGQGQAQARQGKSLVADMADNLRENAQRDLQQQAERTAAVSRQDRVTLSAEARLAAATKVYQALTGTDNKLANEKRMQAEAAKAMHKALQGQADSARNEAEATKEAMEYMLKMMEIARRISTGGQVPGADEQKLLEYSQVLYTMAKMMALNAKEHEKYDSLFEDEEQNGQGGAAEAADAAGGADMAAAEVISAAPAAEGAAVE